MTRMSESFVPVLVRAELAVGLAHAAPWGVALDGLLAAQVWARMKAGWRAAGISWERARDASCPPDLDLPLARCDAAGGGLWHWAATCAWPEDDAGRTDVRTWTGRVDHRHLEQVAAALPKVISARQGRYRDRRMPVLVTPCAAVSWHAVGDPDAIRGLLAPVTTIGKRRTSGEGQVLSWEVVEQPELDPVAAAHLHPDGSLGRTVPDPCRGLIGDDLVDGGFGRAGLRPPYMHPARQLDLHLPAA